MLECDEGDVVFSEKDLGGGSRAPVDNESDLLIGFEVAAPGGTKEVRAIIGEVADGRFPLPAGWCARFVEGAIAGKDKGLNCREHCGGNTL